MNIKINRESFLRVFQIAAAVAPTRSPKPILQNVKLDVLPERAILTATDTEVGVRLNIPDLEVISAGQAVIPVNRLSMILRESGDEFLEIATEGDQTTIKGNYSKFNLQSFNPDEFPEVGEFVDTEYYELPASVLRKLIRRTLFATDSENSRYALGGVLLEIGEGTITAVGTDGRRMAKMEAAIDRVGQPKSDGSNTIVPARSMQLMERILPDDESMVRLVFRDSELLMQETAGGFYTRLVEGRFPKWRDVIPKRTESHQIELPVGPTYSALRQAAIVASDDSRGIDFSFSDGSLVLSNSTADVGESRIEIPVPYVDEDLTISLDHRFVSDFLKVLPVETNFTFDIKNSEMAAYCYTEDNYGYVIMPLAKDRR